MPLTFDGTITRCSRFPEIGEPRTEFIEWLKVQKEEGVKLILWTCRVGKLLDEAVMFCREMGLEFDAINENIPEIVEKFGGDTRKVFANRYFDDASMVPWGIVGCTPKPKAEKSVREHRKARIVR